MSETATLPTANESAVATEIARTELPPHLAQLAARYHHDLGARGEFMWQWAYAMFPAIRLSSVPERYHEVARKQKVLFTIFDVLLDDALDVHGDEATFEAARAIAVPGVTPDRRGTDEEYLRFVETVWGEFEETLREAPRYDEFRDVFYHDLRQIVNSMRYSHLLAGSPALINLAERNHYGPHSMGLFNLVAIDLMYSPTFDAGEYGHLRSVVLDAQRLARIGNWMSTWKREVREGDLTSGVVAAAVSDGTVTVEELLGDDISSEELIRRVDRHGVEERFLDEWAGRYGAIARADHGTKSVDIDAFVEGMGTVLEFQLAGRGHK